jgi:tRNA (adenine(22)-N(1))-methyltransferase
MIGDGLKPLLQNNMKCDTIVVAGMGTSSVMQIIANNPSIELYGELKHLNGVDSLDFDSSYYTFERPRRLDFSHLEILGINRIITQPWPPNILPLHALHSNLLDNGWQYEDQGIDATCTSHITTCFTRKQQQSLSMRYYSDTEIFNLQPLAIKNSQGKLSKSEKIDFISYLEKQKITIDMKIKGLEKTFQSSRAYRKKSETLRSSNSSSMKVNIAERLECKNISSSKNGNDNNSNNINNNIDNNDNDDRNNNNSNDSSNNINNVNDINSKIALRSNISKFHKNDPRSSELSYSMIILQIELCKKLSLLIETQIKY